MILPKLKVVNGATLTKSTCHGKDSCPSCRLYVDNGGRCDGCTPKFKSALADNFQWCFRECHECAGYKVKVTAICCRSPLRDIYMTAVTKGGDWNAPVYSYTQQGVIDVKHRSVFYISSGGVNTIAANASLVEGEVDHVAVNLSRVWSTNGFYSRDLKDYLRLPAKTKLILMTMTLDDKLEQAWQKELYADPLVFQRCGLDAWMPLSFSAYPQEAHMHQYYQLLRTLYATEASHAHFVTGDHKIPGLRTDDLILQCLEKIPQMVFNTQFVVGGDDELLRYHLRVVKHYDALVPAHIRFWLVGTLTPTFVKNMRRVVGKSRRLYYLSAQPLYLAARGHSVSPVTGKPVDSKLPKLELLYENQRNLETLIARYDR